MKEGEDAIQVTMDESRMYGLEINSNKSKIIIFNMEEKPEKIKRHRSGRQN